MRRVLAVSREGQQFYKGPCYVMTPAMVFGYEVEGVSFGTIAAILFGGCLG